MAAQLGKPESGLHVCMETPGGQHVINANDRLMYKILNNPHVRMAGPRGKLATDIHSRPCGPVNYFATFLVVM